MIRNDDNGYERVKRWREKNRARYNLYQRNYRKGLRVDPVQEAESHRASEAHAIPEDRTEGSNPSTGAIFKTKKVGEFRMLVMPERGQEEASMPVVKPLIFRNDYGAVISESQYNALQEKKRVAKEKGYVLDEYSQ